jgi:HEAT repeat protein
LGDEQALPAMIDMLGDPDPGIRYTAIDALGSIASEEVIPQRRAKMEDQNEEIRLSMALALNALGETEVLKPFLTSEDLVIRKSAVFGYAQKKDISTKILLSIDLDAANPWIDPQCPITEERITLASLKLNIAPENVRTLYEAIATDLNLTLSW